MSDIYVLPIGPEPELDTELAARLEAFADAWLTPSLIRTIDMRTRVMAAAHRQMALAEADRTIGAADETWSARAAKLAAIKPRTRWQLWRRPMAAVMAGVVTLVVLTGTAWMARAGGPLYAARLWTEMANLPADLAGRANAEVARLQQRIDEAQEASSGGDAVGAEAALAAYSRIVVEAARNSAGNPEASAAIESSVQGHVKSLSRMVATVPAAALPAVQNALDQSDRALREMSGGAGVDGGADAGGSTTHQAGSGAGTGANLGGGRSGAPAGAAHGTAVSRARSDRSGDGSGASPDRTDRQADDRGSGRD